MKKNLKRNFKRWIAFLLAVVLITTTCVYSSDAFLRAEGEDAVESQMELASEEVEVTPTAIEDPDEGSGGAGTEDWEDSKEVSPEEEESQGNPVEPEGNPEEPAETAPETEEPVEPEELIENPEINPAGSPEAEASPSVSPSAAPAATPEKEAGETYSYAIYYYYDGVEDEDARVEKEDGVLGEKILGSVKVDKEVTIDGKGYKLEKIENRNGEITEDGDNTVKIYYESFVDEESDEEANEYSLEFVEPSVGGTVTVVSVDGEEGKKENTYKENTKVTFEVSADEGYKIVSVQDQNKDELEPESEDEENGVNTYTVIMKEDLTITVEYGVARKKSRVASQTKNEPSRVYVYLKLEMGDKVAGESGWEKNDQGWYTIGYVDVDGLEAASDHKVANFYSDKTQNVVGAISNGGLVKYEGCNVDFDLGQVDWEKQGYGLKTAGGATDYPDVEGMTWHLDGYLKIASVQKYSVTVHYAYADGTTGDGSLLKSVTEEYTTGQEYSIPTPALEGYIPDKKEVSGRIGNADVEVTVYYRKDITEYNLIYNAKGGTFADGTTGNKSSQEKGGSEVTLISAPTREGYEFIGWEREDTKETIKQGTSTFTMPEKNLTLTAQWRELKSKVKISKRIEDEDPSGTYSVGDTVSYIIEVENTTGSETDGSGKTVTGVIVTDDMGNASGTISNVNVSGNISYNKETGNFLIESIESGGRVDITYDYVVQKEDAGKTITNTAKIGNEDLEVEEPAEASVSVQIKELCTVKYILNGGTVEKSEIVGENYVYDDMNGEVEFSSVVSGSETPKIPNPEKNGYTFTGWYPEVDEYVSEDKVYTAQYKRKVDSFSVRGYDGEYDAEKHKVDVSGITLVNGEKIQYYYEDEWLDADEMESNWPVEVNAKSDGASGLRVPVRVIKDGDLVWQTEEEEHPYVRIVPRRVTIRVPNVSKEYNASNEYSFENDNANISYDYGSEGLYGKIASELNGLEKLLTITRTEENKDKNELTTYTDALELTKSSVESLYNGYSNFSFVIDKGDLTITAKEDKNALQITLESETGENGVTYDGKSYFVKFKVVLDGKTLTKEDAESQGVTFVYSTGEGYINVGQKDVGTKIVEVTASKYGYQDSVSNKATVKINPKKVIVKAGDASTVLRENAEIAYSTDIPVVDGLVPGDSIGKEGEGVGDIFTYSLKGQIEYSNVGIVYNAVTLTYSENSINPNYTVKVEEGNLDVKGTVTYNANDNVSGEVEGIIPTDSEAYSETEKIGVIQPKGFKKEGATFLGWTEGSPVPLVTTKTVAIDMAEDIIIMGNHNITLYAVWAVDKNGDGKPDYEQFQLTYDLNGGNGDVPLDSNYYNEGESADLKTYNENDSKPTKDNAVFIGWSKVKHETFAKQPEESVVISSVTFGNGNVTVYAVWAEDKKGPDGKSDGVADYLEHSIRFVDRKFNTEIINDTNVLYAEKEQVSLTPVTLSKEGEEHELILFANAWKDSQAEGIHQVENGKLEFTMPGRDVELEAQWIYLIIKKEIEGNVPEGGYGADSVIPFIITVQNKSDIDVTDVEIQENLAGATFDGNKTSETIAINSDEESKVLKASYKVTEEDLRRASLSNTVTVKVGESQASASKDVPLKGAIAGLAVEKTIIDGKDTYDVGETIKFRITVTNTGTVTVNNIQVTDSFEEAKVQSGNFLARFVSNVRSAFSGKGWGGNASNVIKVDSLKPGKSKELEVTYEVQEEDLGHSGYRNLATAKGTVDTGNGEKEVSGSGYSEEINIASPEESFTLKKEIIKPAEADLVEGKYPVGGKIQYKITVSNTGNTTLKNIIVDDSMTDQNSTLAAGKISDVSLSGNNNPEGVTVDWNSADKQFTVSSIPYKGAVEFTYIYTVDPKDAGKKISNTATIGDTTADSGLIEVVEKSLSVRKTAQAPQDTDRGYQLGETIKYTVTVKNTGNVSLSNIKVQDTLVDGFANVSDDPDYPAQSDTIEKLSAGEEKTFHFVYKVVEEDLENYIKNKAVATVDGETFESNLVQSKVEKKSEKAVLVKKIANSGNGENGNFKVGDTIQYEIHVTNTGTQTLKNLSVTDTMTGMAGEISNVKVKGVDAEAKAAPGGNGYEFIIPSIPSKGVDEPADYTGNIATITYDYVIQEGDAGNTISNTAVLPNDITTETENPAPVIIEKKALEVTKEIMADDDHPSGYKYNTGETVKFAVTVKNIGNVDLKNIDVKDEMTGALDSNGVGPKAVFVSSESEVSTETINELAPEESVRLVYQYTIRPEDIGQNMTPINKATATVNEEPDVSGSSMPVMTDIQGQDPAYMTEKKLHDPGISQGIFAGGEIEYDIEITNTGNTTIPQVAVKDEMSYIGETENGKPAGTIEVISDNAVWENGTFRLIEPLAWGSKVLIRYKYMVTPEDAGKQLVNRAYDSKGNYSQSEIVTIEKKSIEVIKTVKDKKDKENKEFALGETIEFEVTVENTGNVTLSDIVVVDTMQNADGVAEFDKCEGAVFKNEERKIEKLAPGEKATLTYKYTVRENDLGKGPGSGFGNKAEAYVEDEPDVRDEFEVNGINTENRKPKVSVEKTIDTGNEADGKYKVGDIIWYRILVTNTGNTTLEEVIIKDTMTGATAGMVATDVRGANIESARQTEEGWEYELKVNQPILPNDPSKPGQGNTVEILCRYEVKKTDIGKTIGNVAVVGNENIEKEEPENPDPIVVEKREITVTKTASEPADGESYKLNEEITFHVHVENTGNVTLSGISVTDAMQGAAGNATLVDGQIDSGITLAPNAFVDLTYKYTVQPGDITSQNAIRNTVTVKDEPTGDDEPTEGYGETEELVIDEQHPSYTINKSVTSTGSAEGGRYAIGDPIRYQIIVNNTGNVALPNMTVRDQMSGASGKISNIKASFTGQNADGGELSAETVGWNEAAGHFVLNGAIPIGGYATITYDYVVVAEDAGKTITNAAGKPIDSGTKTTETEIEKRELTVKKAHMGRPQYDGGYAMGENIMFDIVVSNTGNVSISDITVLDQMQNAVGEADRVDENGNVLNGNNSISLAAGESVTLHYSYLVQREDIVLENGSGKAIWNLATVDQDGLELSNPDDPNLKSQTTPIQLDREYTLTINYQYTDGSEAASSRVVHYAYGQEFDETMITSPEINGYTPNMRTIGIDTRLRRDMSFTVIYTAIPEAGPTPATEEGEPTPDPDDDGPEVPAPDTTPVVTAPPTEGENDPDVPPTVVTPLVVAAPPALVGAGAGLVAVADTPVPLDGIITEDGDGNIVIVPVEDMEVPLADREIDDHKCCILSFLLMLATLIIYSWFTHSMKKRQKKLAELKDQLAEETLKRQLGITDGRNSKRR